MEGCDKLKRGRSDKERRRDKESQLGAFIREGVTNKAKERFSRPAYGIKRGDTSGQSSKDRK